MSNLSSIIDEVAAAATLDDAGSDPRAHARLLQSIQKLTLAAEKPSETVKRVLYQPPTNIALRIAVEVGLLRALAAADGTLTTAQELARSCNVEELLVIRTMRALAAMGFCDEVGPCRYLSNAVTKECGSERLEDGVKCLYDTVMPAAANMVDYLQQSGPRVPKHQDEAPFAIAEKATLFEWMKKHPEQRGYFDSLMAGRRRETLRWFEIYPAAEYLSSDIRSGPQDVLIVDVGGSHGHDLTTFRARFPGLPGRCILQDLPETIKSMDTPLSGIESMAYDFFTPQPIITMEKGYSTLLIYDYVVPETGAPIRAAAMDLQMMCLFAGLERTEGQWKAVLNTGGLDLVQIWYSDTHFESVIEAKLK